MGILLGQSSLCKQFKCGMFIYWTLVSFLNKPLHLLTRQSKHQRSARLKPRVKYTHYKPPGPLCEERKGIKKLDEHRGKRRRSAEGLPSTVRYELFFFELAFPFHSHTLFFPSSLFVHLCWLFTICKRYHTKINAVWVVRNLNMHALLPHSTF